MTAHWQRFQMLPRNVTSMRTETENSPSDRAFQVYKNMSSCPEKKPRFCGSPSFLEMHSPHQEVRQAPPFQPLTLAFPWNLLNAADAGRVSGMEHSESWQGVAWTEMGNCEQNILLQPQIIVFKGTLESNTICHFNTIPRCTV